MTKPNRFSAVATSPYGGTVNFFGIIRTEWVDGTPSNGLRLVGSGGSVIGFIPNGWAVVYSYPE